MGKRDHATRARPPIGPAARGAAGGRGSCRRARTRAGPAEGSSGETTRPHASWARARAGAGRAARSARRSEPRERRRARTGDAAAGENPRPGRRAARARGTTLRHARDDASARMTSRTSLVTSCAQARGVGPRRRGADARAAARSVPPKTQSRGWKSRCARGVPCRCCGSTAPGRPRTPARAHP